MTDRPSDEMDTMAYAVSFSEAAALIARSVDWRDNHGLVVPFFALIGFALENGLKAVLEQRKVDRSLKWFHSHDLKHLRELTRQVGFQLLPMMDALIDDMSVHHLEHRFRYPQKARIAELQVPPTVTVLTDGFLRIVFDFIDGHSRMEK